MKHFLELKSIGPFGSKLHRSLNYRSEKMQFAGDENSRKYVDSKKQARRVLG